MKPLARGVEEDIRHIISAARVENTVSAIKAKKKSSRNKRSKQNNFYYNND